MRNARSSAFLCRFSLFVLFVGCGGSDSNETSIAPSANRPPTTTSATITTGEDTPSAAVTPSVTDPDGGDAHTFAIVTQPGRGSASIVNNKIIYTPDVDFSGQDNFKFKATDLGGLSVTGTAVVNVTAANDAPAAAGAQRSVYADFAGA